jgi:hypothetical protein
MVWTWHPLTCRGVVNLVYRDTWNSGENKICQHVSLTLIYEESVCQM